MADLSQLGGLEPTSMLDANTYKTQSTGAFILPAAGRYTLRSPESFPATSFGKTQAGKLSIRIDPTIAGPTSEGLTVRFTNISAKVFQRGSGEASMIGDYLKAVGYQGNIPGDPQALADLVEQTAGAQYEAILEWEARHGGFGGFKLKGMSKFPQNADGTYQSWVNHPTETVLNDAGEKVPLRLRANLVVDRYIPRVN